MAIYDKGFTVKACTLDEDGRMIAVKIIPESIVICPVFNVEIDAELHFESRDLALESLAKNLSKITEEEEEENEQINID